MIIKQSTKKALDLNAPMMYGDHPRPKTRREFISNGLIAGSAAVFGGPALTLMGNKAHAAATLSDEIQGILDGCAPTDSAGAGNKIPFICFDLAGGANIAGSNVLVGGRGGQLDMLSTAGFSKLGLPPEFLPQVNNPDGTDTDFINTELGLAFHSDSAFLQGILEKTSAETRANINGVVIPARSENDTGNNPHNPTYGIYKAGARGEILDLIGSRSSMSGGNSLSPMDLINNSVRPTKVDRASDVTGLVDTGDLLRLLEHQDAVEVMESIQRISSHKLGQVETTLDRDAAIKTAMECNYAVSAELAQKYGQPDSLDPNSDTLIVGDTGIFSTTELAGDREFQKTASVMKLVLGGDAGAGTITMGGYDYHTGERATGELRDLRAGRCMGACLEYAARRGVPLMLYVFSDGSVASNGTLDMSENGGGKGVWTGDNQSTAASFYLVYNPTGRPETIRNQVGYMRADASVETSSSPAANNVNLLVQTVILNYMALHGDQGRFEEVIPNHGLGSNSYRDTLIGLAPVVNGPVVIPRIS